jgi:hypothetical protein
LLLYKPWHYGPFLAMMASEVLFSIKHQAFAMPPRRITRFIFFASLLFSGLIALDVFPALRGQIDALPPDAIWVWLRKTPRLLWLAPCALGLALYGFGVWHLVRHGKTRALLLWAFVGTALLSLLLMTLEGGPLNVLAIRTASILVNDYQDGRFQIADMAATLRDWPAFMQAYQTRHTGGIALAPPGLVVAYDASWQFFQQVPSLAQPIGQVLRLAQCQNSTLTAWSDAQWASGFFQMLMPLWAALAVAPLYGLGRLVFGEATARWAVALFPLVPGVLLFMPRFNVWYVLIAVVMLHLLWQGLLRPSGWRIFAAGFVLSVGIFCNLSLIPLGLLAGLTMLAIGWSEQRPDLRFAIRAVILFGLGNTLLWVIYAVLTGTTPFDILRAAFAQHYALNRPYWPWVILHPYDMFFFIGIPLTGLALWQGIHLRRMEKRPAVFALAAMLTLLAIVFSGTARGETGRVWLFFSPVWLLLAAHGWSRLPVSEQRLLWIAQCTYLLSMAAFINANFSELTLPPQRAAAVQPPPLAIEATFQRADDALQLVGLATAADGQNITLDFYWRAESSVIRRPYVFSIIPIDPSGQALPAISWQPGGWEDPYPPACWLPGQTFTDRLRIPLGEKAVPGGWAFSLAISDVLDGQTMQVNGQNQFGIGPVNNP